MAMGIKGYLMQSAADNLCQSLSVATLFLSHIREMGTRVVGEWDRERTFRGWDSIW